MSTTAPNPSDAYRAHFGRRHKMPLKQAGIDSANGRRYTSRYGKKAKEVDLAKVLNDYAQKDGGAPLDVNCLSAKEAAIVQRLASLTGSKPDEVAKLQAALGTVVRSTAKSGEGSHSKASSVSGNSSGQPKKQGLFSKLFGGCLTGNERGDDFSTL